MQQGLPSVTANLEICRCNIRTNNRTARKRFKHLGGGLYRHKSGSFYAVFRSNGKVVWKKLQSTGRSAAREEIVGEIKKKDDLEPTAKRVMTLADLVNLHRQNPLGLAPSTLKIRNYIL